MGPLAPFNGTFVRLGDQLINKVANEIFGDDGAARSIRVIIYNHTDQDLYYIWSGFSSGGFTPGLQPTSIPARSAGGSKLESHGFASGVTGADVRFGFSPSATTYCVRIAASNPYAGDNHLEYDGQGVVVKATISVGNTSLVEADVYPES